LRITPAGLRAIGVDTAVDGDNAEQASGNPDIGPDKFGTDSSSRPALRAIRDGSKLALVLSILRRPEGATLDSLVSSTGWLPHTTRAALTGLRQRGYPVSRSKMEEGRSIYRLNDMEETPEANNAVVEA
jgi:hypothetical protein